jgi:hypothetical protein
MPDRKNAPFALYRMPITDLIAASGKIVGYMLGVADWNGAAGKLLDYLMRSRSRALDPYDGPPAAIGPPKARRGCYCPVVQGRWSDVRLTAARAALRSLAKLKHRGAASPD